MSQNIEMRGPRKAMLVRLGSKPFIWIPLAYLAVSTLWIYFSDALVAQLASTPAQLMRWSMYKGWGFMVVTASLLSIAMWRTFWKLANNQERLRRLNMELRTLSDCSKTIARSKDQQGLLKDVCRIASGVSGYHTVTVGMIDHPGDQEIHIFCEQSRDHALAVGSGGITVHDVDIPLVKCLLSGEKVLLSDMHQTMVDCKWQRMMAHNGFRSAIAVPITGPGSQVLGAIMVCSDIANLFDSDEIRLLTKIADDLAFGITALREQAQRKLAERKLQESEQRLRLAMDSAEIGIWEWFPVTQKVHWSQNVLKIAGFEPDHPTMLSGDEFNQLLHPDDRPRIWELLQNAIESKSRFECEFRVIRTDGVIRWVEDMGHPIYDSAGNIQRMIGTVVDITQRKLTEETINSQRTELAHLSRVAAVGEIGTSLAHELNQPLTAILGVTGVCAQLASNLPPQVHPEKLVEYLNEVMKEANRAAEIMRRVRSFVRKQESDKKQCDINTVVSEAVELLKPEMRQARLRPMFQLADDLPKVLIDPVQIQQVLVNLCQNALDAMENSPPAERRLELTTMRSDEAAVTVKVRDSGQAVAPEMIQSIFESYVTTKPKGLGLGLPISRSIIEHHGGRLTCAANPDGGMTFEFSIPIISHGS